MFGKALHTALGAQRRACMSPTDHCGEPDAAPGIAAQRLGSKQSRPGAPHDTGWWTHCEQMALSPHPNSASQELETLVTSGDGTNGMDFGVWLLRYSPSFCEQWLQKRPSQSRTEKLSCEAASNRQVYRHRWGTLLGSPRKS